MKTNRSKKYFLIILLIILQISFYKINSYATIHSVTGGTYEVDCHIGDTLVFYGGQGIRNWVTINDTTIIDTIALSDGYIGKYKIKGSERRFCIANAEGPWCGGINILTGIIDVNSLTDKIVLFPNPTSNMLSISNLRTAQLFIYRQSGQLVKSMIFNNMEITVNLSEFVQGIYFIEIISNKNRGTYKILKL